jgi:Capsule assembly protein Wzi/PAP2 superfamily
MRAKVIAWGAGLALLGLMLLIDESWAAAPPQAAAQNRDGVAQVQSGLESDAPRAKEKDKEITPLEKPTITKVGKPMSPYGFRRFERDFFSDQKEIWTSPARLHLSDAEWLVPLSGVGAGLFVTDSSFNKHLSHDPHTISRYKNFSDVGIGGLIGVGAGMWLWSHVNHNEHWRETGFLAGEAALNSMLFTEGLKYSLRRERPFQGNGSGPFFQGGTSFPSEHAAAAWSIAGVIAHEYPGPLTKIMAYGLASFVSFSRVRGQQHFNSDIFVGGLIGNFVAQDIYSRRHDPALGGVEWKSIGQTFHPESDLSAENQGSPFVPLDSWVYPVFDRLIALGYAQSGILGQRPWTRLECARLLNEASDELDRRGDDSIAEKFVADLQKEFAADLELLGGSRNISAQVESIYTRFTEISGPPLTDPYHFGETITNDFGRPYQRGFNNVTGFSGWTTAGRWVFYARGEYQHSPSGPAESDAVRNFIAGVDNNPVQQASPITSKNQWQALDAYVGLNFSNWELSYGQQSEWWGPGRMGAFLFSDDAQPVRMFQINRVSPFQLPWIFQYLGPVRVDAYFGDLVGHQFPPNPFFHGEKISFKPTPNLEFGFSRTAVLGGVGRPLTLGAVINSYTSTTSGAFTAANRNPGKRSGGFDFTYRVPHLRNWLTIYADSISDDDPSPLAAPRRAGINPGIYMPQIPGLRNLDLRVEAAYTDVPSSGTAGGHFIYFDSFYHDLYTNNGHLLGNWVGRDGKGFQAWSRYSLSSRNFVEFAYRHAQVSPQFVPRGGNINDASVRANFLFRQSWSVSASVQYERWNFPLLASGPQSNVTSSVQFTYWPKSWK